MTRPPQYSTDRSHTTTTRNSSKGIGKANLFITTLILGVMFGMGAALVAVFAHIASAPFIFAHALLAASGTCLIGAVLLLALAR